MSVPRSLLRLKRIREIEEELHRLALEGALETVHRLEAECEAARLNERDGRRLTESGIREGSLVDRIVGLRESMTSLEAVEALQPKIVVCSSRAVELRDVLLTKRVERRQAETLIDEAGAREAAEMNRHLQVELDDWFGSRRFREGTQQAGRREPEAYRTSKRPDGDERTGDS